MFFTVISTWNEVPPNPHDAAFLLVDNWDDWFSYRTMFGLWVFTEEGVQHRVGSVKIGQKGLAASRADMPPGPGVRSPDLPRTFDALDENFFSLGQDENYYETLNSLSEAQRKRVLVGLNDCAFNLAIFDAAQSEDVMTVSLLRGVDASNVRGRLHRLSNGDATLTEFKFEYSFPDPGEDLVPPIVRFEVLPESEPPTNVHVLIGRNGVGKTRCMRGMAESLLGREPAEDDEPIGEIFLDKEAVDDWSFAGLVMISFSAFDDFDLRPRPADFIRSRHVGLVQWEGHEDEGEYTIVKTPTELASDFRESFAACRHRAASNRVTVAAGRAGDGAKAPEKIGAYPAR
jgi:hypothetical protein